MFEQLQASSIQDRLSDAFYKWRGIADWPEADATVSGVTWTPDSEMGGGFGNYQVSFRYPSSKGSQAGVLGINGNVDAPPYAKDDVLPCGITLSALLGITTLMNSLVPRGLRCSCQRWPWVLWAHSSSSACSHSLQNELWKRRRGAALENAQKRFPLCPQLRRRDQCLKAGRCSVRLS
jgi:hypothetical protein